MNKNKKKKTTNIKINSINDFWNALDGRHIFPAGTSNKEWTLYSRHHEEPIKAKVGDTLVFSGQRLVKVIKEK